MKLNNKGFTLAEVLAVVVILSVLIAIMTPSVNHLINKNKEENYNNLKDGIKEASKIYISDNRYDISIDKTKNCNDVTEISITHIKGELLKESRLPVKWLVDNKDLSTDKDGNIVNPKNPEEILDLDNSYILIKYQCSTKDYTYTIESDSLVWNKKITNE